MLGSTAGSAAGTVSVAGTGAGMTIAVGAVTVGETKGDAAAAGADSDAADAATRTAGRPIVAPGTSASAVTLDDRDGAEDGDDRSAGEEATGGEPRPCVHVPLPPSDSSPDIPGPCDRLVASLNGRRPPSEEGPEGMRLSSYSKPAHSARKGAGMRHPGP